MLDIDLSKMNYKEIDLLENLIALKHEAERMSEIAMAGRQRGPYILRGNCWNFVDSNFGTIYSLHIDPYKIFECLKVEYFCNKGKSPKNIYILGMLEKFREYISEEEKFQAERNESKSDCV